MWGSPFTVSGPSIVREGCVPVATDAAPVRALVPTFLPATDPEVKAVEVCGTIVGPTFPTIMCYVPVYYGRLPDVEGGPRRVPPVVGIFLFYVASFPYSVSSFLFLSGAWVAKVGAVPPDVLLTLLGIGKPV